MRIIQTHWENTQKFESGSLAQQPVFLRAFRISAKLLSPSVGAMQLSASRQRRCISRRAPQIESFFKARESREQWLLEHRRNGLHDQRLRNADMGRSSNSRGEFPSQTVHHWNLLLRLHPLSPPVLPKAGESLLVATLMWRPWHQCRRCAGHSVGCCFLTSGYAQPALQPDC